MMDHDYIKHLKEHNPTVKLLKADDAPLIVSFLYLVFKSRNKITLPNGESDGGFSTTQRCAHEFKHVDQFINGELDFSYEGGKGGLLYDKTDEVAAFQRQNLFSTIKVNPVPFVNQHYSHLPNGPKSFHSMSTQEKFQYRMNTKYWSYGR